jgi:excinuclease ABC subunit A
MHFLPDVWVRCEACEGRRYNEETLAVKFHGQSINDVLEMTCGNAARLFANIPRVERILQTLCDTGLDYLTLGQPAPTLSGGEAQRVKLSAELARPDTGNTLYLLDEPTTGLHFDDLSKLLGVLHRLVDLGNTVVLIEHNMDVIKSADWVIDLGPEAGREGGQVVVAGTPEDVVEHAVRVDRAKRRSNARLPSYTGLALAEVLQSGEYRKRAPYRPASRIAEDTKDFAGLAGDTRMPWESDGRRWHIETRVGRNGKPVEWDGQILERIIERIESRDGFGEIAWNHRSVVEVPGTRRSEGWFLHALTGETWMLKLKFRCRRGMFKREELLKSLDLPTANELDDVPVYGNEPRVKVINQRGPWQEIELRLHSFAEIDKPAFWQFLDTAMDSFLDRQEHAPLKLEELTPWSQLGEKWHFMRKGFPPGKRVQWDFAVLEKLRDSLREVAPEGRFHWTNKQLVHVFLPGQEHPWASMQTKKCDGVWLQLTGPVGRVPLGRISGLGHHPAVKRIDRGRDAVRMAFRTVDDVQSADFQQFLREHVEYLSAREAG